MESNYRNREFEDFIKESADQYRMFPSDRVWKGINNTLHTRRKWYGAGLAFLLLLTGTAVTWVMMSYPVPKNEKTAMVASAGKTPVRQAAETPSTTIQNPILPFSKPPVATGIAIRPATIPNTPSPVAEAADLPDMNSFQEEKTPGIIVSVPAIQRSRPATAIPDEPESSSNVVVAGAPVAEQTAEKKTVQHELSYPLTIESVTNSYQPEKARKKISWQLYLTPTVSYRKLSENNSQSFENALLAGFPFATLTDVNKAVTHKPDMGFQLGLTARYPVSKSLKLRAGVQFNMNRYDIRAFAYNPEVATITLDGSNGATAVSTWTYYRNYSGYKTNWLKNLYFSVSVPIGAELKLFGNDKTNIGIAGTIQPTYIIKDRAYLLSTDYKNYATFPWLVRNINLNTGFEAFVNYSTGKTRWQIGPQVRYQVLSSFHNRYPVKENLFDFGVKLGVTLNN